MYDELVKRLRADSDYMDNNGIMLYAAAPFYRKCADAIEELERQRDRAYSRLCEWCAVCPEDKRNAEGCEIAALNPKPPKEAAKNFCGDCHWYEAEEMYCFRQGCHAYDESSCELWEPIPADEPIPAPGGKTVPTTYDLLYEEGGAWPT